MSETKRPKVQVAYYQNYYGDICGAGFSENEQTVDSLDNHRCYPFNETCDYMQSLESQLAALKEENERLRKLEGKVRRQRNEVATLSAEYDRTQRDFALMTRWKREAEAARDTLKARVAELEGFVDYLLETANGGGYYPEVSKEEAFKDYIELLGWNENQR